MIRPIENLNELDQLFLIEKDLFKQYAYEYDQLEEMYDNENYHLIGYFNDDSQLLEGYLILFLGIDKIEIIKIGTAVSSQKHGIGTMMIEFAKKLNKPLILEVSENNENAINFYLKNGFCLIHERKHYYQDGSNALILEYK